MSDTTNEMSTAEAARLLRIHPKTVLFYLCVTG
ncbi:helix-turn-helix domain-containing protein [Tessaracoccus flavescens]|nr:helix-turn-helix domain-containing protein [Tessaracoccus flavescens]